MHVCHRSYDLCVFSRFQTGIVGLTHILGAYSLPLSLGALSDVTVVLEMETRYIVVVEHGHLYFTSKYASVLLLYPMCIDLYRKAVKMQLGKALINIMLTDKDTG